MRHARHIAAFLAACGVLLCASAALADPVEDGRALVDTYCSDCHAIDKTGDSPLPIAPPFRELHLRYDVEFLSEGLVEGLVSGHPDMPEFEFDPVQAEAIVSYLKSLSEPEPTE